VEEVEEKMEILFSRDNKNKTEETEAPWGEGRGIASRGSAELNPLEDSIHRFCNRQKKEKKERRNRDAEYIFSSQFFYIPYMIGRISTTIFIEA
jgi:hypothetical protein